MVVRDYQEKLNYGVRHPLRASCGCNVCWNAKKINKCDYGPGWKTLLRDFCDQSYRVLKHFKILDICDEYGYLKVSYDFCPSDYIDKINILRDQMETISIFTCETCGRPGNRFSAYRPIVVCDEHLKLLQGMF